MEYKPNSSPNSEQELLALNLAQAATQLGISKPLMLQLARSEGFPAIRINRRWVIPRAALENWLAAQAEDRREINCTGDLKHGKVI